MTEPITLGIPRGVALRSGEEAWKAAALPTELLPPDVCQFRAQLESMTAPQDPVVRGSAPHPRHLLHAARL